MSQPAPFTHLSVVNDKEANFEIKNIREKIYNVDATLIFSTLLLVRQGNLFCRKNTSSTAL